MTVEEYLRSLVPGLDLQENVVARAARSPKEVGLARLDLNEDVDYVDVEVPDAEGSGTHTERRERTDDTDFDMRLDYASSTVYYSVCGVFAGGGYSEQVGDVRASRGGYAITMADRARFKALGDDLRRKWGWEVPEDDSTACEMYDATALRMR